MQIIVVFVPQKVGAKVGLNTAVMGVIQFLANLNNMEADLNDDGKKKIQNFIDDNSLNSRARLLAELKSRYVELLEKKRNSKQSGLEFNPSSDINTDVDKLTDAEVRRLNNWALAIDQLDSHVDNRDRTLTKQTRKISDFPIKLKPKREQKKKIKRVKLELPPIRRVRKNTIKPQQKVDPDLLKGIALNQVMLRDKKDKAKLKAEDDKIKKETMQAIAELKETNDKLVKMERKYGGIIYDILEEQRLDIIAGRPNAQAIQRRLNAAYQELFNKRQVKAVRIAELQNDIQRTKATINKDGLADLGYLDFSKEKVVNIELEELAKELVENKPFWNQQTEDLKKQGQAKLVEQLHIRQAKAHPQVKLKPTAAVGDEAIFNDFLRKQDHTQATLDAFNIAAGNLYQHMHQPDLLKVQAHIEAQKETIQLRDQGGRGRNARGNLIDGIFFLPP